MQHTHIHTQKTNNEKRFQIWKISQGGIWVNVQGGKRKVIDVILL